MMTKQEKKVQLAALAREIHGHELAVISWTEQQEAAEEREDADEVNRLATEIAGSEKTIRIAKEQIAILSDGAETPQQRGRTTTSSRKSRAGAK